MQKSQPTTHNSHVYRDVEFPFGVFILFFCSVDALDICFEFKLKKKLKN